MVVSTDSIKLSDAAFRLLHTAFAFEGERLGNDRDGERAHFAGERRDNRGSAGSGATAESGGHEDHVGAFERFDDFVGVFERGFASDFRIGARAQAVCEFDAKLNLHGGARHAQGLKIRVCDHELDALHAGIDHAVYGVTAASTHADDFYLGVIAGFFVEADANVIVIFQGSFFMGKAPR